MAKEIVPIKEMVDVAITKIKEIEKHWIADTFKRYRECGRVILEAGYKKGLWKDDTKEYFLEETGYSQQTFGRMVQLGEMPEDEFNHSVINFKSLHQWTVRNKGKRKAIVVKPKPIKSNGDMLEDIKRYTKIKGLSAIVSVMVKNLQKEAKQAESEECFILANRLAQIHILLVALKDDIKEFKGGEVV